MKVNPIKVFQIPSDSKPGKSYRVQYDGARWFCECPAWVFNLAHKGEKDAQGRSAARECKHSRQAESQMQAYDFRKEAMGAKGKAPYREVQPLGPWFEELQEYVGRLMDFSKNGAISTEVLMGFRRDMDRFKEEAEKVKDALEAADTFLGVYRSLLSKIADAL